MGEMREQINAIDDRDVDRVAAIIKSMTPGERDDPRILNGSRRSRIARGAGVTVSEVNGLVERFSEAQKMMRQIGRGGGLPGMPVLPGMPGGFGGGPGGGKRSKGKAGKKSKAKAGRSGNPAKRALEAQGRRAPVGLPSADSDDAQDYDLPKELRDLLAKGDG